MKLLDTFIVVFVVATIVSCENAPTVPTTTETTVTRADEAIAPGTKVEAQPPSCEWRDQQVAKHMAWGGTAPAVVTLSNGHRVYIVDTGDPPYYRVYDYPQPWCIQ